MFGDEETVYDSFGELVEAAENGEVNPSEVRIVIDNDYVQAYLDNPDLEEVENMSTIPNEDDWDVQFLAYSDTLPRSVLIEVFETLGFNAERP